MLGLALNVGNVAEVHRVALLGALATRVGKRLLQKYARVRFTLSSDRCVCYGRGS